MIRQVVDIGVSRSIRSSAFGRIVVLFLAMTANLLSASDYDQRRASALQECAKISWSEHQTGLIMNPDGYRSYYVRSQCLQDAAVHFRDASLCAQVRRRWSIFSSWGISTSNCRKLVGEKTTSDRAMLEGLKQSYTAGAMKLESLRIQRNGNGRDFDLLPTFSGSYSHGYLLTFEILPPNHAPVVIHSNGYYVDNDSNLRIYVRQSDIKARFPEFTANSHYQLRATATLSVPVGDMDSVWPDSFVEGIFPVRERSSAITIDAQF